MLTFHNVDFWYRGKEPVLHDLNLDISSRSTVLLGPNGAGKSTLMALSASALRPKRGSVSVQGVSSVSRRQRRAYKQSVSWLPQDVQSISGLRVREQVAFAGWLKGLSKSEAWSRSQDAIERTGLVELAGRPSHRLSGGQLRRLGIAEALVVGAPLVILDEPTAGLDPEQRYAVREIIASLSDQTRVIVSTHITDDIESLYDDVIVINDGKVLFHGNTAAFLGLSPGSDDTKRAEESYIAVLRGTPVHS